MEQSDEYAEDEKNEADDKETNGKKRIDENRDEYGGDEENLEER